MGQGGKKRVITSQFDLEFPQPVFSLQSFADSTHFSNEVSSSLLFENLSEHPLREASDKR